MRIDVHSHFIHMDFIRHLESRTELPRSYQQDGAYSADGCPSWVVSDPVS